MAKLAVVHHRHLDWVPALQAAEPRIEVRGWHPKELDTADGVWLAEAEALFCWKLPKGLAARMPMLAWVQNSGAGVDHLVHHPELRSGIPITRADGAFGFWMARYTAAHLLMETQRVLECAEAQSAATWDSRLMPEDLTGKTALVVGFGRIGRQIGRALKELGMGAIGIVRVPRPDPEFELRGAADLPDLLPDARALILAAPLTEATRGMVDSRLLARGHAKLTLINVGRGELLAVEDLIAALDGGRLGRAVLDVFPEEPLPADSPLWRHPKVVVTPHHSGPSVPAHLIPDILPNLRRFAAGLPIEGAVDRTRGY
ncbi:MAG TPA: D-2-hydroxyacid dehydrogenase [Holophagaceae bacterium]|jgi:phosphoglycerate dehydrogenase-like enzyme|nr:D-2-hydroxyacid dehydrogenase [Holophagaceae bacterium]